MREFRGKVAVVTGAASGIGRALAAKFGEQGMKLVLGDVEADALERAAREFEKEGFETLAVVTDVTRADDVSALAERTLEAFGAVHVVFNNAGVFTGGSCWEAPLSDYEWVLGVNLWGVIHGIRTFVPILLEQDCEGHVVNTASMAAVTNGPLGGIYTLSKHAVLALSETLYLELTRRGSKIGVSALCPEVIATRIADSDRNRPEHLKREAGGAPSPERDLLEGVLREVMKRGLDPAVIAERVLDAIRDNRFYILSEDDAWRRACETRLEDIRLGRNPTLTVPVGDA